MSNIYIVPRCYWYNVYNDMQARVPTCEYYGEYGHCPCDYDCKHYISKQEADDIIWRRSKGRYDERVENGSKIGEWIFEKTDEYKRTYCSVCGVAAPFVCVSDDYYGRRSHGEVRKTKFCPNCGADMRGENK